MKLYVLVFHYFPIDKRRFSQLQEYVPCFPSKHALKCLKILKYFKQTFRHFPRTPYLNGAYTTSISRPSYTPGNDEPNYGPILMNSVLIYICVLYEITNLFIKVIDFAANPRVWSADSAAPYVRTNTACAQIRTPNQRYQLNIIIVQYVLT